MEQGCNLIFMTSQAVDGKQGGVKIVEQNCNWCVILNGINDYVGRTPNGLKQRGYGQ